MELISGAGGRTASRDEAGSATAIAENDLCLSWPVRSAIRHMKLNYADSVTLCDLSQVTRLSAYQIIRAFRRELGITPHAWLIRHRVRMGTTLLKSGESIATVASEVGFVDQTHFTRHFKRLHGETPARFLTAERSPSIHPHSSGSSRSSPASSRTHLALARA